MTFHSTVNPDSAEKNAGLSGGEKFLFFLYLYFLMVVFDGLELIAKLLFVGF